MTRQEFEKIPFRMSGHVSMAHEHTTTYVNADYSFVIVCRTKVIKNGLDFGKTRREYLYKGERYKKFDKFLEAIKDVKFKG